MEHSDSSWLLKDMKQAAAALPAAIFQGKAQIKIKEIILIQCRAKKQSSLAVSVVVVLQAVTNRASSSSAHDTSCPQFTSSDY